MSGVPFMQWAFWSPHFYCTTEEILCCLDDIFFFLIFQLSGLGMGMNWEKTQSLVIRGISWSTNHKTVFCFHEPFCVVAFKYLLSPLCNSSLERGKGDSLKCCMVLHKGLHRSSIFRKTRAAPLPKEYCHCRASGDCGEDFNRTAPHFPRRLGQQLQLRREAEISKELSFPCQWGSPPWNPLGSVGWLFTEPHPIPDQGWWHPLGRKRKVYKELERLGLPPLESPLWRVGWLYKKMVSHSWRWCRRWLKEGHLLGREAEVFKHLCFSSQVECGSAHWGRHREACLDVFQLSLPFPSNLAASSGQFHFSAADQQGVNLPRPGL